MKSARLVVLCAAIGWAGVVQEHGFAQRAPAAQPPSTPAPKTAARPPAAPKPAVSHAAAAPAPDLNAVVKRYCVGCHNDSKKLNDLSLSSFDVAHAAQHADVAEKM